MRLSPRDFDALQGTILELYDLRDLGTFLQASPTILLKVIPADYFQLNEFKLDMETNQVTLVGLWESCRQMGEYAAAQMVRLGPDHPFTKYSFETGDPTALKFSDFFSQREFRGTELYREVYRHMDVGHLLATALVGGPTSATLNLGRRPGQKDFSERDRLMMNLLRPHFEQARRNARLNTARSAAEVLPLHAYGLTPREAEIAHWVAIGKTNLEIAVILQLRVRTVEKHMERILIKLAVENRTAAAVTVANARQAKKPMN